MVLEKSFTKMSQSGRLLRERQVRDEVLAYYGFRVNYLEKENNFRRMPDDLEV